MNKENKKVEVSELLAEIVRNSNGTVALYIFEAGSQHVETIHTQNVGAYGQRPTPSPSQKGGEQSLLPEVLATDEAMTLEVRHPPEVENLRDAVESEEHA